MLAKLAREMEFLCYRPRTGSFVTYVKIVPKEYLLHIKNDEYAVTPEEFDRSARSALMPQGGFYAVGVRDYRPDFDDNRPTLQEMEAALRLQGWKGTA